jgi:hypothetical protein
MVLKTIRTIQLVARLQALVLLAFFWGLQSAAQNLQIH